MIRDNTTDPWWIHCVATDVRRGDVAERTQPLVQFGSKSAVRQRLSTAGLPSTVEEPYPASRPEVTEPQNRKLGLLSAANRAPHP